MKEQTKAFFKTVMKSGGLFNSKHFSLKVIKKDSFKSEIKVIISKKVISSAVLRNRLKRRVQNIFKKIKPQSLHGIFYAKSGSGKLSFKELQEEISYLINNIK